MIRLSDMATLHSEHEAIEAMVILNAEQERALLEGLDLPEDKSFYVAATAAKDPRAIDSNYWTINVHDFDGFPHGTI